MMPPVHGPHGPTIPRRPIHLHRAGISWEISHDFPDRFGRQGRLIGERRENHRPGEGALHQAWLGCSRSLPTGSPAQEFGQRQVFDLRQLSNTSRLKVRNFECQRSHGNTVLPGENPVKSAQLFQGWFS